MSAFHNNETGMCKSIQMVRYSPTARIIGDLLVIWANIRVKIPSWREFGSVQGVFRNDDLMRQSRDDDNSVSKASIFFVASLFARAIASTSG